MKFNRFLVLILSVATLFVSACSKSPNSAASDTLNLNIGGEPTILNPILATDAPSSEINGLVFSGLFRINTDMSIVPDLVATYSISTDGLTYTFKLRDNVKWHDGQPFTADDVKFTFDKILDPKTNTVRRSNYILNGKSIQFTVVDTHTITATLPESNAPFLSNLCMSIIPKHILQNQDINTATFNRQPIGTGPFKFQKWDTGQFIILVKNDTYYLNGPKLGRIIAKIIPDTKTALVALEKQEIDSGKIPFKDTEKYQNNTKLNVHEFEDLNYTFMAFNLKNPIFKDIKIRQAIAHAIDKKGLTDKILKGHGSPAHIPAAPISWSYPNNPTFPIFEYNPTQSARLLDQAGWQLNPATKIREKNGKQLSFTLITNQGNQDRERSAQIIQQYLSAIGIQMNIQLMEWSSFVKRINSPTDPKPFDAVMLGWSLDIDPDDTSIWHSKEYPKGFNFIAYNNLQVDTLLDQGRKTIDQNKRKIIYSKLYTQIASDIPYIFLYYPNVITGINKRVKGLSPAGPAGLFNPIENVYIQ
jgi:peptide/nickel transport system substrate-binding protein